MIDPLTTYLYNKGDKSYCYFTLSPRILMLIIWTILLCMFFGKKILKDFLIFIPLLIFIPFYYSFPLSGGIMTWTNLNQNYPRVFWHMFQLSVQSFCRKKIPIIFFIYSYEILHPYPIVAHPFSANQYLNKFLSLLSGYVFHKSFDFSGQIVWRLENIFYFFWWEKLIPIGTLPCFNKW